MKNIFKTLTQISLLSTAIAIGMCASAMANPLFSLENLERERAALLATLSDATLNTQERHNKANQIYRRMSDIERMVLRDERIAKSDKIIVKRAFESYELTFLVHASAEANLLPMSHWLHSMNIDSSAINKSQAGVR